MSKSAYSPVPACACRDAENSEVLPLLAMQTPTIAQLGVAVEVLAKLGERLNIQGAYAITQLPETALGAHYAGNIGTKTMEQIERVKTIATQLKNWREEMWENKRWDAQQGADASPLSVFTQSPRESAKKFVRSANFF